MDGFHERLRQAIDASGMKARAVSLRAGLSADTIGKLLKNHDLSPTIETVIKIAQALGINEGVLAFGVASGGTRDFSGLRVTGEVAAGVWNEADADTMRWERTDVMPDPRFPASAQFLLRARGNSMNNIIQSGELLHCVHLDGGNTTAQVGNIVIVERRRASGEREVSAKKVAFDPETKAIIFRADSDDPQWRDYRLATDVQDGEEIAMVARVLRVVRDL